MRWIMAPVTIDSLTSGRRSWSTISLRYRTSQAKVRSTTQRLGCTTNPSPALAVVVTAQPQKRLTQSMKRLLKPESTMTSRSKGNNPRTLASSQRPPSRSCTDAATTITAQTRPSESVLTNRLRPLIFFPPVVPLGAAAVGRLDRLAVHPAGFRRGRGAGVEADLRPQRVVELLPVALDPPGAEAAVDGLPGREVARQHAPGASGAEVVEDGVEHLAGVGGGAAAVGAAGLGAGQQRLGQFPLLVRQVGRVSLPVHDPPFTRPTKIRPDQFQDTLSARLMQF